MKILLSILSLFFTLLLFGAESNSNSEGFFSQANSYSVGINGSVSPQTGKLSMSLGELKWPLPVDSLDFTLSVSYDQAARVSRSVRHGMYGLPKGWSFNIGYIQYGKINKLVADGKVSLIDPNWSVQDRTSKKEFYPGLRYYNGIDIKFKTLEKLKEVPFAKGRYYRHIISSYDGGKVYYDNQGKYIGKSDRFGNYILVNYKYNEVYPQSKECKIKEIVDSFGYKIKFHYTIDTVRIVFPDGSEMKYSLGGMQVEFSNRANIKSKAILNSDGYVQKIISPTGGSIEYKYKKDGIKYKLANGSTSYLPIVSQVISNPNITNNPDVDSLLSSKPCSISTTNYNYYGSENNYTGYGEGCAPVSADGDSLSNIRNPKKRNDYRYKTTISKVLTSTSQVLNDTFYFNFLHTPVKSEKRLVNGNDNSGGQLIEESNPTYWGSVGIEKIFPNANELDVNGLTIKYEDKDIYSYKDGVSKSRKFKTYTKYDKYKRPINTQKYDKNNTLVLEKNYEYDYDHFGLMKNEVVKDCITGKTITTNSRVDSETGKFISDVEYFLGNDIQGGRKANVENYSVGISKSFTARPIKTNNKSYSIYGNHIKPFTDEDGEPAIRMTTTDSLQKNKKIIKVLDRNTYWPKYEEDALGRRKYYKYDISANHVVIEEYYIGENGEKTYWKKMDGSTPNIIRETDSSGFWKEIYFDGFARVIKQVTGHKSKNKSINKEMRYNELGKVYWSVDDFGNEVNYVYNFLGELVSAKDYLGNEVKVDSDLADLTIGTSIKDNSGKFINADFKKYNENGKAVKKVSNSVFGSQSQSMDYNGFGQLTSAIIKYEGNKGETKSARITIDEYGIDGGINKATVNSFDGINSVFENSRDFLGNSISEKTTFNLPDNAEKLLGLTSKYGNTIDSDKKDYNDLGMLIKVAGDYGYEIKYDKANRPVKVTKNGSKIEYKTKYDYWDQVSEFTITAPGKETLRYTYEYNKWNENGAGQIKSATLSTEGGKVKDKITYTYDKLGHLASVSSNGKTMLFEYDEYSRLKTFTDYFGVSTSYFYEDNRNPSNCTKLIYDNDKEVKFSYYTRIDSYLFGAGKTVKSIVLPNDLTIEHEYYTGDETNSKKVTKPVLKSIRNIKTTTGKLLASTNYKYDLLGSPIEITNTNLDSLNNEYKTTIKKYKYNSLKQLISESTIEDKEVIEATNYLYDLYGNIRKKSTNDLKN